MEEARLQDLTGTDDAWAHRSLDALLSLPGVRRAGLALVEGGGRRLTFTSAEHASADPVEWCHVDAYDDVPLNTAVRTGRAVVGDWEHLKGAHAAFVDRQHDTGFLGLAAVPLVAGGRTIGGFVVFYRDTPDFGDAVVRQLDELGARLGEALRRTRSRGDGPVASPSRSASSDALVVQFPVGSDPSAVGPARRELYDTLRAWGTDVDTTEIATLCLSELVTNAVVHAGSGCAVEVTKRAGTITVSVRNAGAPQHLPDLTVGDPLQVHGRGRQLVDALASRWGSVQDRAGFTTWFMLEL